MAADSSGKTRLRRTRTGCLKCRTRRRKCDEGKPSCQRCLDGGFDCRYGTRLSFLNKNAITVAGPGRERRQSYTALKFVEPESVESSSNKTAERLQEDAVSSSRGHDNATASGSPNSETLVEDGPIFPLQDCEQTMPPIDPALASSTPLPQTAQCESQPRNDHLHHPQRSVSHAVTPVPSDNNGSYETALDVLLSLRARPEATPSAVVIPRDAGYFSQPGQGNAGHLTPVSQPGNSWNWLVDLYPTCTPMPRDRVVQLLRHFRYNVAPWLDIGDPCQTFGLEVSRLAMDSVPVLEALCALSLASIDRLANLEQKELGLAMADAARGGRAKMDVLDSVIIVAFTTLRKFVTMAPTFWTSPFRGLGLKSLNAALAHEDQSAVRLAVSWVLLRLDVTVALMTGAAVSIPDILPYGIPSSTTATDMSRDALGFDREPLLLCAKVLNHCFGKDTEKTAGMYIGLGTTQNWTVLFDALGQWYANRPREFKPMLELDDNNNDQLFPLILFTNGAAVLGNQLYHTAMLLLLQNRPKTLPGEPGRSVLMSPLWHAQRVCGISLNNEGRNSWDFSLVASFYLAAKRMTYIPQQQALLKGIERCASITGWNLQSLSTDLARAWQPD